MSDVSLCGHCGCMTHTLERGKWRLCDKCKFHKEEEEKNIRLDDAWRYIAKTINEEK